MNILETVFSASIALSEKYKDASDYVDGGILHCGKCHTPKQILIPMCGKLQAMPCMCSCMADQYRQEREALKERERQFEIENNRWGLFPNRPLWKLTFANDDMKNAELSKLCRNYAKRFSIESKWLMLYGGTGVGKSFMAACIANEIVSRGFTARFTTVSQFERKLFGSKSKYELYAEYTTCDLLVIDDVGAERDSDYMKEILFNLIDERVKNGKPIVITTNLPQNEIVNPSDISLKRLMSRIAEKSILYFCKGNDRRYENIKETNKQAVEDLLSDE